MALFGPAFRAFGTKGKHLSAVAALTGGFLGFVTGDLITQHPDARSPERPGAIRSRQDQRRDLGPGEEGAASQQTPALMEMTGSASLFPFPNSYSSNDTNCINSHKSYQ